MTLPAFDAAGVFGAGTASISLAVPSGLAIGQVAYAALFAVETGGGAAAAIATATGWTLLGTSTLTATGGQARMSVFRRVVPSGGFAAQTWTCSGSEGLYGAMSRWSGVDLTTPEDVAIAFQSGNNTTPTAPSATTVTGDALQVGFLAYADNWDTTSPSAGATLAYGSSGYSSITGTDGGMACIYKGAANAGATGTISATMTQSPAQPLENWLAATVALRPAVPGVLPKPGAFLPFFR